MQKSFQEVVERIVEQDPRYDKAAYDFIKEVLEFTIKQTKQNQGETNVHVTGAQLMEGFRQYANKEFGPLASTVLDHWNIRSSEDVGEIVFNLINAGVFGRAESDQISDFRASLDFYQAFEAPYESKHR
jgi:uncharacterized repeat protein (TIGR04138 family)